MYTCEQATKNSHTCCWLEIPIANKFIWWLLKFQIQMRSQRLHWRSVQPRMGLNHKFNLIWHSFIILLVWVMNWKKIKNSEPNGLQRERGRKGERGDRKEEQEKRRTHMGACGVALIVLNETVRPWHVFLDIATECATLVIHLPRAVEWRLASEQVVPVGWPTVDGSTAAGSGDVE